MSKLKDRLYYNWTPMRMLRTGTGIVAAIGAIQSHDILLGCVAAFLLYQGFANVGCCGMNNCNYVPRKDNAPVIEPVEYEEVK